MGALKFVKEILMTFRYPANIISDKVFKLQSAPVNDYAKKAERNWS